MPFVVLLPVIQTALQSSPDGDVIQSFSSGNGFVVGDLRLLGAGLATQLLDLGVLAVAGRQIVVLGYQLISPSEDAPEASPRQDVFLAMSLLTVVAFSQAANALGYSESLGAFLAGIVIADTKYSHRVIETLKPLKSLFLSVRNPSSFHL